MKKIDWKSVGKFAKDACQVAVGGIAVCLPFILNAYRATTTRRYEVPNYWVTYSDAVRAIMDSDMFSSQKIEAVELLKRDSTSDYYKAVICVVNSDMFTSQKIETIEKLS